MKKNINLQKVFMEEEIQCMNTNLIITVSANSFFKSCGAVFDVNKWDKIRHFQKAPKFHILSADLSFNHIVLFGEPRSLQTSASDFEYNFLIKVYTIDNYDFLKQSVLLHEDEVTQWSQVRISERYVILFESHFMGKDLSRDDNCDAVHIFNHVNPESEFIEHVRSDFNIKSLSCTKTHIM